MSRRERTSILLGPLLKLLLVGLGAAAAGVLGGIGVSALSSRGDPSGAPLQAGAGGGRTSPRQLAGARAVEVHILSAVLEPASTPSGIQRRRARVTVLVRARNSGKVDVTPARPALLAGGATVQTDPRADAPGTQLGTLAAGATATVTLQFEVAGNVTSRLLAARTAHVVIAGHTITTSIGVGAAVGTAPASPTP